MAASEAEKATLGGGCFWCLEALFEQVRGVRQLVSGYAGGHVPRPTYEQVCTGETGHAEVVQVTFDPGEISYRELLQIFFAVHDPTTPDRQGADVGTQYRSIILYHDAAQRDTARQVMQAVEDAGVWKAPLVTQLVPYETFYPAEDYHQTYYRNNPQQPYCQLVVAPKLAAFRRKFADKLQD